MKKIHKLIITTILAASLNTASVLAQSKKFNGASISVGGSAIGSRVGVDFTDTSTNNTGLSFDLGKTDLTLSGEASYTVPIKNNFAFEIGVNGDLNNEMDAGRVSLSGITLKYTYGSHYSAYIKPIYLINDSSGVFIKVGAHEAKAKLTASEGATSGSEEQKIKGTGYGAGVKSYINNNLFIQAEVNAVDYDKISETISATNTVVSHTPRTVSGTVMIGYQF